MPLHPFDVLEVASGADSQSDLWLRGWIPGQLPRRRRCRQPVLPPAVHRHLSGARHPAALPSPHHPRGDDRASLADARPCTGHLVERFDAGSQPVDQRADGHPLRRPPGRSAAGPAAASLRRQHPQAAGEISQGVCARQRVGPRATRHRGPPCVVRPSGRGGELGRLRDREPSSRATPPRTAASFYRTAAGAEVDLVLELPGRRSPWIIEIKRSLSPRLGKGFHHAREDVRPERTFVVYAGEDRYPVSEEVEAIGLREMVALIGAP